MICLLHSLTGHFEVDFSTFVSLTFSRLTEWKNDTPFISQDYTSIGFLLNFIVSIKTCRKYEIAISLCILIQLSALLNEIWTSGPQDQAPALQKHCTTEDNVCRRYMVLHRGYANLKRCLPVEILRQILIISNIDRGSKEKDLPSGEFATSSSYYNTEGIMAHRLFYICIWLILYMLNNRRSPE